MTMMFFFLHSARSQFPACPLAWQGQFFTRASQLLSSAKYAFTGPRWPGEASCVLGWNVTSESEGRKKSTKREQKKGQREVSRFTFRSIHACFTPRTHNLLFLFSLSLSRCTVIYFIVFVSFSSPCVVLYCSTRLERVKVSSITEVF